MLELTKQFKTVFSTCVEVILLILKVFTCKSGILHVCGGDPDEQDYDALHNEVFSTCVEVIPHKMARTLKRMCILHVCGGDPHHKT